MAPALLTRAHMSDSRMIGIRHVERGEHRVAVVLTRNASGSVSGECLLAPTERPIIDGPTVDSVLRTIGDSLDALVTTHAQRVP